MRRPFSKVAICMVLGLATSVAVAWIAVLDVSTGSSRYANSRLTIANRPVGITVWRGGPWTVVRTGPPTIQSWSHLQATGRPDTTGSGDIPTAWASATQDGQVEWLELRYLHAVVPSAIEVHETYNTGALTKVTVFTVSGREVVVWEGADPTPRGSGRGVSRIKIDIAEPVDTVRITLDSPNVRGWNEIDAVALFDENGKQQWAVDATASSTYNQGTPARRTRLPEDALPYWCPIPDADKVAAMASRNQYQVATGWPLRCFRRAASDVPFVQQQVLNGWGIAQGVAQVAAYDERTLPLRPIWSGLLVNTLLFAMAWWLLAWVTTPLRRWRPGRIYREAMRARRGRCPGCNFDLQFELARGCPECGWRRVE
jgi:hypothetical protein